jgi:hypothetical protein
MQVHVLFLRAHFFTFVLFKLLLGVIGVMKLYHPISILYLISHRDVEILYSLFLYIFLSTKQSNGSNNFIYKQKAKRISRKAC